MNHESTGKSLNGTASDIRLMGIPDFCPRCHRSIHPQILSSLVSNDHSWCQTVFRCTHQKCEEAFIGTYRAIAKTNMGRHNFELRGTAPHAARDAVFPESVATLSANFVEIFNQTESAASRQLDQLVGIGLRKALEFLIKDYATSENIDKQEQIKKMPLAACIEQFVADPNVRECAKRAAWLGNDETHYIRKWGSKDVNDLRVLVKLTVNWIENSLMTKKYLSEMNASVVKAES